jgi:hypothetical protein
VADELRLLVTGARQLPATLTRMAEAGERALLQQARSLGRDLASAARRHAPRDRGNLIAEITSEDRRTGSRVTSGADYSYFVHQGTRYRDADPFLADAFEELGLGSGSQLERAFDDSFVDALSRAG